MHVIIYPLSPTLPSGLLLINLHTCLQLSIYSKPLEITKLIVIASVNNLALVDKIAKQSATIFHADIDAKGVRWIMLRARLRSGYARLRSVSACSPKSTSFSNCERVYANKSNAIAKSGFGPMLFKRIWHL